MLKPENKLWILKAKGEDSSFGGNLGYPDEPSSHYVYDTNVKNHNKIKKGDFIVIVNKDYVLGHATITSIGTKKNVPKIRYRCPYPECGTQEHYIRKSKSPKYKCRNKHEFDKPAEEHITVDEFTANYKSTYKPSPKNTSVRLLDKYYIRRNLYYSIQEASSDLVNNKIFSFINYIEDFQAIEADEELNFNSLPDYDPSDADERESGKVTKFIRKGQREFKSKLIKAYGSICMITGCNINSAIEASHICPYRGKKDNNVRNGLLLRVDLHRLYDNDLLSINPLTLTVEIHTSLKNTYYQKYNGKKLVINFQNRFPSHTALDKRWQQFQSKLK